MFEKAKNEITGQFRISTKQNKRNESKIQCRNVYY